jgi:uncharacterized SAM-binding protein YcdF (DUF218 family)
MKTLCTMKTKLNPGRLFSALMCALLIVVLSLSYEIAGAQTTNNNDAEKSEINKKPFGTTVKRMVSLFSQPFISKRSMKQGPFDVIIVPGIPYDEEKGAGMIMRNRIIWAYYLISEGVAENVIFSGSAVYSPYIESEIMAMYMKELGIASNHIFCETKAEHSTENVVYSLRMAEKLGFKKIAIATGPFQSAFLSTYVEEHSLPVSFIPLSLISLGDADPVILPTIDPSAASVDGFISLLDRETRDERQQK